MEKLLIGVCAWYNPPFQCVDALWRQIKPDGVDKMEIYYSQSYNTFLCRNEIAEKAMRENYGYILFVDCDNILYDKNTVAKLFASLQKTENAHIMAGLYRLGVNRDTANWDIPKETESADPASDWEPVYIKDLKRKIYNCRATGFGCVLARTGLFHKIEKPYFNWADPQKPGGDDVYFCRKAGEAGFAVWGDAGARVGHLKQIMV